MGKPRPGDFSMRIPPDGLARLLAARDSGATVKDLARRFDRSQAWVRTALATLRTAPCSSEAAA